MSSSVSVYDAWCDGSYRDAHNRGGAGWVVRHNGQFTEGNRPLPTLDRPYRPHGSDIAEVMAVVGALREIPAHSTVRLRMDCQNVMDWLRAGAITTRKKTDITPLQTVFGQAMALVASMENVELIKVGGRTNEHLGRAHNLSRAASTAPQKTR